METLSINHSNGNSTNYQLLKDGNNLPIAYHSETSKQVIEALELARTKQIRVKIHLGDVATGKDWNEQFDVTGYVRLSRGNKARFPILVYNTRSFGGGSILDHCIVKIVTSKGNSILYTAKNYNQN